MGFLRNRAARRFPLVGLLSDLAMVGAAAGRFVQQRRNPTAMTSGASTPQLILAGAAAFRLIRRAMRARRRRKLARLAAS